MNAKILSQKEYPYIKKLKKKYEVTRVLDIKARKHLEILELISKNGIFKAYGKNTKEALKNSKKVLKKSIR